MELELQRGGRAGVEEGRGYRCAGEGDVISERCL